MKEKVLLELSPLQVWLLSQTTDFLMKEIGDRFAKDIFEASQSLHSALDTQVPDWESPNWYK